MSTLGDAGGLGDEMRNLPTAAASVIRLVPILKDILGVFRRRHDSLWNPSRD